MRPHARLAGWLLIAASAASCRPRKPPETGDDVVHIVVVGTNDLHGALRARPVEGAAPDGGAIVAGGAEALGGWVRAIRQAHPGRVLLVDAGDMWSGTLDSNPSEGESVVALYRHLGYAAAALGNHEFDFGPEGPVTAWRPGAGDPQGALRARARQAAGAFALLGANVIDEATGEPVAWENVAPARLVEIAGVRVGVVGIATPSTPRTTQRPNVAGLRFGDPAEAVHRWARDLRARGAAAVVALAHMGGECRDAAAPHDPRRADACAMSEEFARFVQSLAPGEVDAVVAGHTHHAIAHFLHGVPVVESGSGGTMLGRVDLFVDRCAGRVLPDRTVVHPTTLVTASGRVDGVPVGPDARARDVVVRWLEETDRTCARPVAIAPAAIRQRRDGESALGDLVADAMRAAVPGADAAIQNAGGIRADLRAGPIGPCEIFEVLPFDNAVVEATLRASEARTLVRILTSGAWGVAQVSGLRLRLAPRDQALPADLDGDGRSDPWERDRLLDARTEDGRPLEGDREVRVVLNDFVANGGDGAGFVLDRVPAARIVRHEGFWLRDALARYLASPAGRRALQEGPRGGRIDVR